MNKEAAWFDRIPEAQPKPEPEDELEELDISPKISPWIEPMYNPLAIPNPATDPERRTDNGQPRSPRDIMNSVIMSSKENEDGNLQEAKEDKDKGFGSWHEVKSIQAHEASAKGDVDFALIFRQKISTSSSWRSIIIAHDYIDDDDEVEYQFPDYDDAVETNKEVLRHMPGTGNHEIGHGGPGLIESALMRPQNLALYSDDVDIFDLAGSLANAMVENHPFENGNHRTAHILTHDFLHVNGFPHVVDLDDHPFARKLMGLTEHGRGKLDDPFRDPDAIMPEPATADDVADMFRQRHIAHLEQDHPKHAKIAGDVERRTCRFCKRAAVRVLVWAGGSAMLPVCGKHIGMGNRMIHEQKQEVVDRIDLTPDTRGDYHDFKESDPKHEHHNVTS